MTTRIKTKSEFNEKMEIALNLQSLIKSKKSTKQNVTVFLVLMSELKEFAPKMK
tara:strand:- start:239 stop:400 length:162 start_codon:yes stop_codon:yes gene_type:complete